MIEYEAQSLRSNGANDGDPDGVFDGVPDGLPEGNGDDSALGCAVVFSIGISDG